MEGLEYLCELCEGIPRCGPGENESTRRAFNAIPKLPNKPLILDIGCGTGMQTIELAKIAQGTIIALDNHQSFLDELIRRAQAEGCADRIVPQNMSMLDMDFDDGEFDIIWSEGALYCMGFENGLRRCHQLLKKGGYLVVTEVVYLLPDPPEALIRFWEEEYPDIKDVMCKIAVIEDTGYRIITHFTLPKSAWLEYYYIPIERKLKPLRKKYKGNQIALNVFDLMQREINIYREYSDYFGYEFFVMQRSP